MTTELTRESPAATPSELSPNTAFELLLDEQRRYALRYLSGRDGPIPFEEFVDGVARLQGMSARQRLEELALEFHHNHLCRLAGAGVLRYDRDAGTVERRPAARALEPYLELAAAESR
ncbi:hypothetical protein [Natronococcus sp.]|uniref:DUF7344 domain-containing protein n=1 Tax=Natronococcus sp. TaxID=35747 RepID=UPI003A4DBC75